MSSDIQKIISIGKKYLEVRIELLKLDIEEEASKYIFKLSIYAGILVVLMISLFLATFGIAVYINQLLDNQFLGFFIISGFYAGIVLILIVLRKNKKLAALTRSFVKFIIQD
jgi:hypothetical protein